MQTSAARKGYTEGGLERDLGNLEGHVETERERGKGQETKSQAIHNSFCRLTRRHILGRFIHSAECACASTHRRVAKLEALGATIRPSTCCNGTR
eukprot:5620871-Alexandrium_andersonii.AAC.1